MGVARPVLLALLLVPVPAAAEGLDAQLYHPSLFGGGVLGVDSGQLPGHLGWHTALFTNWARRPLQLVDSENNPAVALVDSVLSFDAVASLGLGTRFELGVGVPLVAYQDGDTPMNGMELSSSALGDLRLGARLRLWSSSSQRVHLFGQVNASLPSGDDASYTGAGSVGAEPGLAVSFTDPGFGLSAVAAYHLREENDVLGGEVASAPGLAASAWLGLGLGLDALLAAQAEIGDGSRGSPVEARGGLRYRLGGLELTLAAGVGLTDGYGTPELRLLAGVAYASTRAGEPTPIRTVVADSDADRDGDGIVDRADSCPDKPGIEANRGCPDVDSDGDQLADRLDKCPSAAGPAVNDGCPDLDQDGDELVDREDGCPERAGPAANRGCPDEDGDGDGLVDRLDKCPKEAEVYNGLADDDGCADEGEALVVLSRDQIQIRKPINFDQARYVRGDWQVRKESYLLLATVAKVLFLNPDIKKVRIEGHTDDKGGKDFNQKLSEKRAQAVRKHLVEVNGVEPERLDAAGLGFDRPVAPNDSEANRAKNRRVEFVITERQRGGAK